jgi:hypothetical protein
VVGIHGVAFFALPEPDRIIGAGVLIGDLHLDASFSGRLIAAHWFARKRAVLYFLPLRGARHYLHFGK